MVLLVNLDLISSWTTSFRGVSDTLYDVLSSVARSLTTTFLTLFNCLNVSLLVTLLLRYTSNSVAYWSWLNLSVAAL